MSGTKHHAGGELDGAPGAKRTKESKKEADVGMPAYRNQRPTDSGDPINKEWIALPGSHLVNDAILGTAINGMLKFAEFDRIDFPKPDTKEKEDYHVTLLWGIKPEQFDEASKMIDEAKIVAFKDYWPRFDDMLGYFMQEKKAEGKEQRVLAIMKVDISDKVKALQKEMVRRFQLKEQREFKPHVTLLFGINPKLRLGASYPPNVFDDFYRGKK